MAGERAVGGIINISGGCVRAGLISEEAEGEEEAVVGGRTVECWSGMKEKVDGDEGSVATEGGRPKGSDAGDRTEEGNNSKDPPLSALAGNDSGPGSGSCEGRGDGGRRTGTAALSGRDGGGGGEGKASVGWGD